MSKIKAGSAESTSIEHVSDTSGILELDSESGVVSFINTAGITLPVGTTAQRPVNALPGSLRINTTTGYLELFYNNVWNSLFYVANLNAPTWTTAAGTLATYDFATTSNQSVSTSVTATDVDPGDTITYSVVSGSLPTNLTLNSTTGTISGSLTQPGASSLTTSFTIRATDAGNNTSDRIFNIIRRWLDGSSQSQAASSVGAIKSLTSTTTSGYYWITIGGTARQIYCDMTGATAWMLAMRASGSGTTNTFGWSSAYWTNATGLNETGDPLTNIDIKQGNIWQSFTVTNIRLTGSQTASSYTANPTATFTGFNTTLQNMFGAANNSYSSNIEWGRSNWLNWATSTCGTSTSFWDNQPNCNVDAVNAYGTYHGVRFGITMNNEADCATNDSGVGFGHFRNGQADLSCGAVRWNPDTLYPCHGWFWVN